MEPQKTAIEYFNLGVAEFKANELESAWIHFGMANARSQDPAVDQALQAVSKDLQASGRSVQSLDPASDLFLNVGERLPLGTLTLGSGLFFLVTAIIVVVAWMKKKASALYWSLAGVAFFLTLSLLILSFWVSSFPPVWVIKEEIARTGPGTSFLEVERMKVATKLRFVRKDKDWIRVRLNRTGAEGYLPAGSLLLWGDE